MAEQLKPFEFKPGNPGGPGRPPEACKALKKYTKQAVAENLVTLMEMSVEELEQIRGNKQEKGIRSAIASVILKCRAKGEFYDLNEMLNRVIGKVPQKTELSGTDGVPLNPAVIQFVADDGEDDPSEKPQEQPVLEAGELHKDGVVVDTPPTEESPCNAIVEQEMPLKPEDLGDIEFPPENMPAPT